MIDIDKNNVFNIPDDTYVTVTQTNHIVEMQYLEKQNIRNNIRKINEEQYIVLSTGEIRKFKKGSCRYDSKNSFRQTFKKLRYLINNNFVGSRNELFVTLTYKENMQDPKQLYSDMDKFIKRLRYHYKKISDIEYINVVEPQKRGAWHCHILMKFVDLDKVYIDNEFMARLWSHGFVNVRALNNMSIDNIGAYLTAYLSDIPIDELKEGEGPRAYTIKEHNEKQYIKGGRLFLYPKGMNLYRASRGIKMPNRKVMKFSELKKCVNGVNLTHFSKVDITVDDFNNTVIYYYYNLKRTN